MTEETPTFTLKDLKSSKPLDGQEFCAYVYLLSQEPVNNIHGLFKVIATGSSSDAVQNTITKMIDQGKLEANLPHINIGPTGTYGRLMSGEDPKAERDVYNTSTKRVVTQIENEITEKRKAAANEVKEATKRVQEESKQNIADDPESYETYTAHRGRLVTVSTRLKQLEGELEFLKNIKKKTILAIREVEKKHAPYKLKYKRDYVNAEVEDSITQNELTDGTPSDSTD